MKKRMLIAAFLAGLIPAGAGFGATFTWDGGGANGDFTDPDNWADDAPPVSGADSLAFASSGFSGHQTVNLDAAFTAFRGTAEAALLFNANTAGGKNIIISGTSALTLDGNGSTPALLVQAGAGAGNTITAPLAFQNSGGVKNSNIRAEENLSLSSVNYPDGGSGRSFWTALAGKTVTISKLTGTLGTGGSGDITFVGNGSFILDGSETNTLAATLAITESFSGAGEQPQVSFAKTGGARAYNGTALNLFKGKLTLAGTGDDQINDAAQMNFGSAMIPLPILDLNGRSETLGQLRSFGGTFDFSDPAAESLWFQSGGASSWSGTLTILGFEVGVDTLRFGTSAAGLTAGQLATISFGGIAAQIDATGYVTPIPEPAAIGLLCFGGLAGLLRRRFFIER